MDGEWTTDWSWLAGQRERWLREEFGSGTLWPARLAARAQSNLVAFTDYVARQAPQGGNPRPAAVGIAFFGPPGIPPPEIWNTYVALHEQLAAAVSNPASLNPFDITLALGCGWGRAAIGPVGQWEGRWEVAYAAMINQLSASVLSTNRLLIDHFPQFAMTDDDMLELPGYFALSLLVSCDCGHHRRGCATVRDGHACERDCCFPPHDLRQWDPSECHLRPFIDQAVRGTAAKQILGGAFAESLTYSALEREGRVLRRRVEFKRCPGCQVLYDDAACPTPACEPAPDVPVPLVARANWLIHPEHEGGNYRELERWVCGSCGNLYAKRFRLQAPLPAGSCPVCGWGPAPGARPRTVTAWARIFDRGSAGRRGARRDIDLACDPYEDVGEEADDDDE